MGERITRKHVKQLVVIRPISGGALRMGRIEHVANGRATFAEVFALPPAEVAVSRWRVVEVCS